MISKVRINECSQTKLELNTKFRLKYPADLQESRLILLDETQPLSNKMKAYVHPNGTWMFKVRSNVCHMFHSSDRINIGFRIENIPNTRLRLYLSIDGVKKAVIKSCADHNRRLKNKVFSNTQISHITNSELYIYGAIQIER